MNESMEMKGALIQEAGAEGQETLYEERPLPIGQEQLQRAWNTLLKYRADKARLEKRIVDNQQWYRLRQWESMREGERQQVEPVSLRLAVQLHRQQARRRHGQSARGQHTAQREKRRERGKNAFGGGAGAAGQLRI